MTSIKGFSNPSYGPNTIPNNNNNNVLSFFYDLTGSIMVIAWAISWYPLIYKLYRNQSIQGVSANGQWIGLIGFVTSAVFVIGSVGEKVYKKLQKQHQSESDSESDYDQIFTIIYQVLTDTTAAISVQDVITCLHTLVMQLIVICQFYWYEGKFLELVGRERKYEYTNNSYNELDLSQQSKYQISDIIIESSDEIMTESEGEQDSDLDKDEAEQLASSVQKSKTKKESDHSKVNDIVNDDVAQAQFAAELNLSDSDYQTNNLNKDEDQNFSHDDQHKVLNKVVCTNVQVVVNGVEETDSDIKFYESPMAKDDSTSKSSPTKLQQQLNHASIQSQNHMTEQYGSINNINSSSDTESPNLMLRSNSQALTNCQSTMSTSIKSKTLSSNQSSSSSSSFSFLFNPHLYPSLFAAISIILFCHNFKQLNNGTNGFSLLVSFGLVKSIFAFCRQIPQIVLNWYIQSTKGVSVWSQILNVIACCNGILQMGVAAIGRYTQYVQGIVPSSNSNGYSGDKFMILSNIFIDIFYKENLPKTLYCSTALLSSVIMIMQARMYREKR